MKSSKKSLQTKKSPKHKKPGPLSSDQETVFEETAHMADRDQVFSVDQKTYPPDTELLYDDSWTPNTNERVNDDRSTGKDLVNALRDLVPDPRPVGPIPIESEIPTVVDRTDEEEIVDDFELMPDKKLKALADALSIPARAKMTRHEMIEAVRSSGGSH